MAERISSFSFGAVPSTFAQGRETRKVTVETDKLFFVFLCHLDDQHIIPSLDTFDSISPIKRYS
jgi:hypothetical protein